jgi:hypothetical protein
MNYPKTLIAAAAMAVAGSAAFAASPTSPSVFAGFV